MQNIIHKTKTNWSNGGVTYQVAVPQNSFGNGASSKEIEIHGFESKNTRERERAMVIFFLEVGDDMG